MSAGIQTLEVAGPSAPQSNEVSRIRIRAFTQEIVSAWDQFVLTHPNGTFFHLTSWMNVVRQTFGYRPCYMFSERNGVITGVLPLFHVNNWITGHCLISTPFSVSGGLCAADSESESALLAHVQELAQDLRVEYMELRQENGTLYSGFHPNSLYSTFRKELVADVEANLKRIPSDTRYMIRRATKAGLTARHGLESIDVFYRLFAMNMHHHGTPMFPRSLFENILRNIGKDSLDLLVVYLGDEPISAVLSFFFRDTVLPYYAGLGPKANKLGANNFMYWELMKHAVQMGYRRFDFGRSKKDTGAYFFKTQWNMEIQPLNYQVYLVRRKTSPNFSPVNPKFERATKLWQKLPLWGANLLGPSVVKWFP